MTWKIDVVTRSDARKLVRWWNGHTAFQHEARRSESSPRFWMVVRL